MRKKLLCAVICTLFSCRLLAQGELPVNMYTGAPDISISLTTVSAYGLHDNVVLRYDGGGVKANAAIGSFGVNWSLSAGGYIRREVRGLPDDYMDKSGSVRGAWLSPGVAESVAALPNNSDGNSSTCTDETADAAALALLGGDTDTEPDVFYFNVEGMSGKFVFDNSSARQIRLIPYKDLVITPQFISATDKRITGFTITTSQGVVYQFNNSNWETRFVTGVALPFLKNESDLYSFTDEQDKVRYTSQWDLSSVVAPSGANLTYTYTTESFSFVKPFEVYMRRHVNTPLFQAKTIFTSTISGSTNNLSSITSSTGAVVRLERTGNVVTAVSVYDQRDGDNSPITTKFIKKYVLRYNDVNTYLMSVQEVSGDTSIPPYRFSYHHMFTPGDHVKGQDYWGYCTGRNNTDLFPALHLYPQLPETERFRIYEIPGYAGEHYVLPGANRTVDVDAVQWGSLISIDYPWGGTTKITYESNRYFDAVANQSLNGGGIRVKSSTYLDGANPDVVITTNLVYDDDNDKSFGQLISTPSFVIPTSKYRNGWGNEEFSYSAFIELPETLWQYMTVRTDYDLSRAGTTQGGAVGYKQVKVYRPGAGYAHFEFSMPGAWLNGASDGWEPSSNTYARKPSCPTLGILNHLGRWSYPFSPTADIDVKRGRVLRKREYAQDGALVREIVNEYQYVYKQGLNAPSKIYGVMMDIYPYDDQTFLFGKYYELADYNFVEQSVTEKIYDATDITKYSVSKVEYEYSSPYHRFLSKVKKTGIDGTVQTTVLKYPLDYGTVPSGADKAAEMIGFMQQNYRNGAPIEQYTSQQRPGAAEYVVNGSITEYNDFGVAGRCLPKYQRTWRAALPLQRDQFVSSSINNSTKKFEYADGYDLVNTIVTYDSADQPSQIMGEDRIPVATVWSSRLAMPVLTAYHVSLGEFAFSDFEAGTEASFNLVPTSTDGVPVLRTAGGYSGSYGLVPEASLSKILTRNGDKYILSGWWSRYTTTYDVQVTIKNVSKTTTYYSHTFSKARAAGTAPYEYFEYGIPMTNVPADFYVEILFNGTGTFVPGSTVAIDDMAFYPAHGRIVSSAYQFPFGVTSTSQGRQATHTVYDPLGRIRLQLDRDKSIRQRNTYTFTPEN